jgi:integrase
MAIRYDEKTKTYTVSYYKRHPLTKVPLRAARKNIRTKAEARRVYNSLVVQIEDRIRSKSVPTWKSLVESFAKAALERGLTQKTIDNYTVCLVAHTFEDWGDCLVDSITTQEIRDLIKAKVGERSESHQKNLLKFIRGVFKHGVELGVMQRNPTPDMRFRIGDKIKKVLTEEQISILLTFGKRESIDWYPHWCMAAYTGMRSGELYALTWDKVSFSKRQILVDTAWNKTDGFKSTKSGDDRIVEIAPPLLVILKELKVLNQDSVFVLPRLTKWDKGEQARDLRMYLMGLNLPTIRFHDLRASWATVMLGKGVPPAKVMKMGGWKDLKTMQKYIRKAGVDIKGITDNLVLHDPTNSVAEVLDFSSRSNL